MINKYLILGSLVVVIAGTAFWFARPDKSLPGANLSDVVIELNEEGFVPKETTILKGQKVTFKTRRGKIFWPASDLHPTHSIYSEFDPQGPIEPDQTWTFQFNKTGEWKYHDHLFPYYRGVIKVVEKNKDQVNLDDCDKKEGEEIKQLQCWDDLVRGAVKEKGIAYSMRLLADLYKNPVFAKNCHSFSHTIGSEAYFQFKKEGKIEISPEVNYCGFGFYHGFMEMLFARGDNIQLARDLCAYMDKQINNPSQYANGACFHGIGHGVVDGSNKAAWGNPQALLDPGLKLCDKVAVTDEEHYRCYSGAFNSISIAYATGSYGLVLDQQDPLKICRQQEDKYKRGCYSDMAVAVMDIARDDLRKAIKFIEAIEEDVHAIATMGNAAALSVRSRLGDKNFNDVIDVCRSAQDRLRIACIRGFGVSLIEFGEPGREYARSFDFCGNSRLNDKEKEACFRDVLYLLRATVDGDEMDVICAKAEEQFPSSGIMTCNS